MPTIHPITSELQPYSLGRPTIAYFPSLTPLISNVFPLVPLRRVHGLAPANKIRGIVDAAGTHISSHLRVRAQGSRAPRPRTRRTGFCNDTIRGRPLLDPVDQGCESVELIGGRAAGAVCHTGYRKDADEVRGGPTVEFLNLAIPRERVIQREHRIGGSLVHDHPSAMRAKSLQMW